MSDDGANPRAEAKDPPDHDWLEQESIRKDWMEEDEENEDGGE